MNAAVAVGHSILVICSQLLAKRHRNGAKPFDVHRQERFVQQGVAAAQPLIER
jgi:hypothetical protein